MIKQKATELTKAVDELLAEAKKTEEDIEERDRKSIKKQKLLKIKEEEQTIKENELKEERELLEKEKKTNYDKQIGLEAKEKRLAAKIKRVQSLMND